MKRQRLSGLLIILLTAGMGLAGCSDSSTDTSDPDGDSITGTWQLSSLVFSMGGGIELDVTDMDSCLLETTLTFEEDGDFHYLYSSAGNGDECSTSTGTGSWEHESGNSYSIAAEGLPVGQGTQEISFSNNNNTFSFSENLQFEGLSGEAAITFNRQ